MHPRVLLLLPALALPPAGHACIERVPTPDAWLGPHDFTTAPGERELWKQGDPGEPLALHLKVLDTCGEPIPGVRVHLLHADHDGEHRLGRNRAILHTDRRGAVNVLTLLPGYAGDLPRHIHFVISHPGYTELITRLYFKSDPAAGAEQDPLAMVIEELRHGDETRWVGGYEFVLSKGG